MEIANKNTIKEPISIITPIVKLEDNIRTPPNSSTAITITSTKSNAGIGIISIIFFIISQIDLQIFLFVFSFYHTNLSHSNFHLLKVFDSLYNFS